MDELEEAMTLCNPNNDQEITRKLLSRAKAKLPSNTTWNTRTFETLEEFKKAVRREILKPRTVVEVKSDVDKMSMKVNPSLASYEDRARKLLTEYLLAAEEEAIEVGQDFEDHERRDINEMKSGSEWTKNPFEEDYSEADIKKTHQIWRIQN